MTTAIALRELGNWLSTELADSDPSSTVVLAGHYAIFSAGGVAADFLGAEAAHPPAASEMIAFTKFTWNTACEAIASHNGPRARLLVLIDDVTFMRPLASQPAVRERLGDALASRYLADTPAFPAFHAAVMNASALSDANVFKQSGERWTFSERELRVAHVRRLKSLLTSGGAGGLLTSNADQSEITVTTGEYGAHCLVQSGHTNCAGGYLELLASLEARGVRKLIALVPMRCLRPIAVGATLANDLFSLHGMSVVNVAVPDVESGVPVSVMRGA